MSKGTVSTENFREAIGTLQGSQLDREKCVLRNVRLCGFRSENGRDYSREALRQATPMYENAPVYLNHPGPNDVRAMGAGKGFSRDVEAKFGVIRNARWDSERGPVGDLHYNGGHRLKESFEWAADNDPSFYSLSHNAAGKSRPNGSGRQLVESISKIFSVDLVDRGATTGSLHEAELTPMDWREQLANAVAEILKDTSLDKGQVKGKIDSLIDAIHEDNEPSAPAEGAEGDEAGDAPAKPQPAEAMEAVLAAYPNDPNVAVLLEQAGLQITATKRKDARKWATDKGVPEERLTEGAVDVLVALTEEPLRESYLVTLKAQAGVKAAESTPVLPNKVAPKVAPKAKPDSDAPPVKELVDSLWK